MGSGPERISLSGEYDCLRQQEVAEAFARLGDPTRLELDFANVSYIDSTFLTELVRLRRRLPDCQIAFVNVNENISRVLKIVDFDKIFQID